MRIAEFNKPITLEYNKRKDPPDKIVLQPGEVLFVVGRNGSGKSTLLHGWAFDWHSVVLAGHRPTSLWDGSLDFSAKDREMLEADLRNFDFIGRPRFLDPLADERNKAVVWDLYQMEAGYHAGVSNLVTSNTEAARGLRLKPSPLERLNAILTSAGLGFTLGPMCVASRLEGGRRVGVEMGHLSDGERAALMLAMTAVTTKADRPILVDEPERHLHPSIVAPLLRAVFEECPFNHFVIATHNPELPAAFPRAQTLVLHRYEHDHRGSKIHARLLSPGENVPDDVLRAILGAKRKVLFVEGANRSLDALLYKVLFPEVEIIPKQTSREVVTAVSGVASTKLAWVKAFGLIDRDARPDHVFTKLQKQRTFALRAHSVEGLYCDTKIQALLVATKHPTATEAKRAARLEDAKRRILHTVKRKRQELCAEVVARTERAKQLEQLPTSKDVLQRRQRDVRYDLGEALDAQLLALDKALEGQDVATILTKYPMKSAGVLQGIATALGFKDVAGYEEAVQELVRDNVRARNRILTLLGDLPAALAADADAGA